MPNKSSIEWTDYTSNPVYAINIETGKRGHHCVHKNPLCENCYAEAINLLWGTGLRFIAQNGDKVRFALSEKELDELSKLDARLLRKGEAAKVFMFDMTDIGLPGIPRAFIFEVLDRIATFKALTVQLLTKRPVEVWCIVWEYCCERRITAERFKRLCGHVHMGASVGTQRTADEDIPELLKLAMFFDVLWLSIEPLLEDLDIGRFLCCPWCAHETPKTDDAGTTWHDLNGVSMPCPTPATGRGRAVNNIAWAVIGGESGAGARQTSVDAIKNVSAQFEAAGVPRFIKQVGSKPVIGDLTHWRCPSKLLPDGSGYLLKLKDAKGGDVEEWPADLRVREFPSPFKG